MTEKTEGGAEREEAGAGRREAAPNPRTYSDFMRNLAAKYNTENSSESSRAEVPAPRLSQLAAGTKSLLSLPPGIPLGFPPFLLPPTSLQEVIKDSPFQFLPGMRPAAPRPAPAFPPGVFPPGLLDPSHAQALLTMMRGQHPASARPQVTPDPASEAESPAKRQRRNSSCLEAEDSEAPVSPPPSSIPQQVERSCRSECSVSQACSEEGRRIISWSVDQVVDFISNIDDVKEHAEAFAREKIDGSTLVLLTDSHLTSLGIKLGPAIRLRSILAKKLGTCVICSHCQHCHVENQTKTSKH